MLKKTAVKQFRRFDKISQEIIKNALRKLEEDPFHSRPQANIKKLQKTRYQYYRLRIGNLRVIYTIEDDIVYVISLIPRKQGYDWLD